ncbi:MAG: flagellar basal body P-ring formation chaperone FlgA [Acetobacteraceae bacterium]|nr:flagellar basal body P-ring formation chaperone FlgA [Acetobacteraceae bacterium]
MRTFLLALAVVLASPADAAEVVARSHAEVAGPTVRVSDLFEGAGPAGDRALGPAPAPGSRYVVPPQQLAAIARAQGLRFAGGGPTVVERPGRTLPREAILVALRDALGVERDREIELGTFAPPMVPLAASIRVVAEDVQVDPASGRFSATIAALADGEPPVRSRVGGRLAARTVTVPVAARRLAPGTTIAATDLRQVALPIDRVPEEAIVDEARLRGRMVQRAVAAGSPILAADLGGRAVVARNSAVTMSVSLPGLVVTAQGRALEDGAPGDVIQVMNLASRAVVEATVLGPGRVAVAPGSLPISRPASPNRPQIRAELTR